MNHIYVYKIQEFSTTLWYETDRTYFATRLLRTWYLGSGWISVKMCVRAVLFFSTLNTRSSTCTDFLCTKICTQFKYNILRRLPLERCQNFILEPSLLYFYTQKSRCVTRWGDRYSMSKNICSGIPCTDILFCWVSACKNRVRRFTQVIKPSQ